MRTNILKLQRHNLQTEIVALLSAKAVECATRVTQNRWNFQGLQYSIKTSIFWAF